MNENASGLQFKCLRTTTKSGSGLRAALWLSLTAAVIGAVCSMLELAAWPGFAPAHILEGLRLLCNRLFSTSERYQYYIYNKLAISLPEAQWGGALGAGLVLLFVLAAVASGFAVFARRRVFAGIGVVFVVGVQIYFGVFPSMVWNVLLFGSFAAVLADTNVLKRQILLLMIVAIAAVGLGTVVYRGVNPALYTASEAIRDAFGEKVENPATDNTQAYMEERKRQNREEEVRIGKENSAMADTQLTQEEHFAGAQIGSTEAHPRWIPIVTTIVLVLLVMAWVAYICVAASRRRAFLDSADTNTAVIYRFLMALDGLCALGLEPRNRLYSACIEEVGVLLAPQAGKAAAIDGAAVFAEAEAIWREAVFSTHTITAAQCARMRLLAEKLLAAAYERGNTVVRVRLAWIRFYGGAYNGHYE